jgi:hypothetical protein
MRKSDYRRTKAPNNAHKRLDDSPTEEAAMQTVSDCFVGSYTLRINHISNRVSKHEKNMTLLDADRLRARYFSLSQYWGSFLGGGGG